MGEQLHVHFSRDTDLQERKKALINLINGTYYTDSNVLIFIQGSSLTPLRIL